jgi:hypothetical protein
MSSRSLPSRHYHGQTPYRFHHPSQPLSPRRPFRRQAPVYNLRSAQFRRAFMEAGRAVFGPPPAGQRISSDTDEEELPLGSIASDTSDSIESDTGDASIVNSPSSSLRRPFGRKARNLEKLVARGDAQIVRDKWGGIKHAVGRCPHCHQFCNRHRLYDRDFIPSPGLFQSDSWKNRPIPECDCRHDCVAMCRKCTSSYRLPSAPSPSQSQFKFSPRFRRIRIHRA